jgi:hypothetical protein
MCASRRPCGPLVSEVTKSNTNLFAQAPWTNWITSSFSQIRGLASALSRPSHHHRTRQEPVKFSDRRLTRVVAGSDHSPEGRCQEWQAKWVRVRGWHHPRSTLLKALWQAYSYSMLHRYKLGHIHRQHALQCCILGSLPTNTHRQLSGKRATSYFHCQIQTPPPKYQSLKSYSKTTTVLQ